MRRRLLYRACGRRFQPAAGRRLVTSPELIAPQPQRTSQAGPVHQRGVPGMLSPVADIMPASLNRTAPDASRAEVEAFWSEKRQLRLGRD